jgi:hypothetical protein
LDIFSPINIAIFLIDVALAIHVVRTGRSMLWLVGMALTNFLPGVGILGLVAIWIAYLIMAVIPDFLDSNSMRRFRSNLREAADPGRDYREKKRAAALIGSVDSKRALAEESLKRGLHAEAIALYQ